MNYGATSGAAIAAAKQAEQKRKEEEEMTPYKGDDLEGWEFKIVRSHTGAFKKNEFLQKVIAEESKAGWEMLEKFDEYRVRFKRRTDKRANDQYLQGIDPYRTVAGISGGRLGLIIAGSIILGIGILMLVLFGIVGVQNM